jgi:soluble lytic murein transglycosylase-like protein
MTQLAVRRFAGALWKVVKATLMVTGLVTLVVWEVDTFSQPRQTSPVAVRDEVPPLLDGLQPTRLAGDTLAMAESSDRLAVAQLDEHKRVATYLARKYRVAADATNEIVGATYRIGKELGVDPFLILAVMAIESRMNPFAESGMGAMGLMQVIPKYHLDKFEVLGGPEAVLNPVANIRVGALILKDVMQRFGGLESGLKAYSGATGDDYGYAAKVLAERDRLRAAAGLAKIAPVVAIPVRIEARQAPAEREPSGDDA